MNDSPLFAAIDLHSDNSYATVLDGADRVVLERRIRNRLGEILAELAPFKDRITAVAVESTFNWYWLVDGLMDAGYEVRLVNTNAARQYDGLKHGDDRSDARWLAHLMRLGILPTGYIMPKKLRAVRDLLRKRMSLVQQRTANVVSFMNLKARNEAAHLSADDIQKLKPESAAAGVRDIYRAKALEATVAVINALDQQIRDIEAAVAGAVRETAESQRLRSIWGVGKILSMTIQLETGPISRFASPGDYASYCRCVKSKRLSNGKVKGKGNDKCGNRYLAWAWVEAANFAIRFYPKARAFYQKKAAKKNPILARKALAHKLARAGWHMLRSEADFDPARVFG